MCINEQFQSISNRGSVQLLQENSRHKFRYWDYSYVIIPGRVYQAKLTVLMVKRCTSRGSLDKSDIGGGI